METKLLRRASYFKWIEQLLNFQKIYGVVSEDGKVFYRNITSPKELVESFIISDMSAKSYIFPPVEKLFTFIKYKDKINIENVNLDIISNKIIIGLRPCDAIAIKNLVSIFKCAPEESFFMKRVDKIIIITYACNKIDDYCFCTSIGGSPGNVRGSDILLTKTNSGDYITEIITNKGKSITSIAPKLFEEITTDLQKEKYLINVPIRFENAYLEDKINNLFNTSIFDKYAMRCIGCNICAFVCPVCTCFDIQDEMKGIKGHRIRCWDSCGSKLFTLHTSGYNPRSTQGMRWRQRLMHKFSYIPKQIHMKGYVGCVGCGRCSRHCPVDMSMSEQLADIVNKNYPN